MAQSGKSADGRGGIQSLERAATILDAVVASPDGIGLAELSGKVGLHTSTTFHLTRTLVALGFLVQNAHDKCYRVGSRLFALAAGALDEKVLLAQAMPVLERLSVATGQAAHLAVRSGERITVVARTAATGLLQLSDQIGATRPPHATAIGKVLLAAMEPDDLNRLLDRLTLARFTDRTIVRRPALIREIARIRRDGVAYDDREFDEDVRCIAVQVHDFAGRCAGAMGLSGPAWRLTDEHTAVVLGELRRAADDLSSRLGFQPGELRQTG